MAIGLKGRVQVSTYIPKQIKRRMDRVREVKPRYSYSFQIEEALGPWLEKQEEELEHTKPTQTHSGRENATV